MSITLQIDSEIIITHLETAEGYIEAHLEELVEQILEELGPLFPDQIPFPLTLGQ